jgi:hypothetical protein
MAQKDPSRQSSLTISTPRWLPSQRGPAARRDRNARQRSPQGGLPRSRRQRAGVRRSSTAARPLDLIAGKAVTLRATVHGSGCPQLLSRSVLHVAVGTASRRASLATASVAMRSPGPAGQRDPGRRQSTRGPSAGSGRNASACAAWRSARRSGLSTPTRRAGGKVSMGAPRARRGRRRGCQLSPPARESSPR